MSGEQSTLVKDQKQGLQRDEPDTNSTQPRDETFKPTNETAVKRDRIIEIRLEKLEKENLELKKEIQDLMRDLDILRRVFDALQTKLIQLLKTVGMQARNDSPNCRTNTGLLAFLKSDNFGSLSWSM